MIRQLIHTNRLSECYSLIGCPIEWAIEIASHFRAIGHGRLEFRQNSVPLFDENLNETLRFIDFEEDTKVALQVCQIRRTLRFLFSNTYATFKIRCAASCGRVDGPSFYSIL